MSKYYMGPSPLLVTAQHRRLACFLRPQSALGGGGRNRERQSGALPQSPNSDTSNLSFPLRPRNAHRPRFFFTSPSHHLSSSSASSPLLFSLLRPSNPSIGVFCIVHSLSELQVTGL
ncbi:hypothetical protein DTO166G4_7006 [Paecilomyces variotii]|nr:hypothetical protein DTO164E3_2357 [Paecilomyces variotii]KAJ9205549.1 hypothetical protein DTO032I3_2105 [Paecilomyces variotii]KAJ9211384.1 hypothetical protein DTO166G4_7006 [Paecilomyces variotii]KAJ9233954.1 hypothetical protein DTO166G5_5446 [Paecilomyces variotii]KAJ9247596.1 hypothetical protein DTO207G8_7942 [Paecilomyces variotii]